MSSFPEVPSGAPSGRQRGVSSSGAATPGGSRSNILNHLFRLRYWLHAAVFVSAFAISWATSQRSGGQRVWLSLPLAVSQHLGVPLQSAIVAITALAVLSALAGAALRTWGTAYLGTGVVIDGELHGSHIVTSGPFGHLRNPLYVGTVLHALTLCVLLNWIAAGFLFIAVIALQIALIAAEERYLSATSGEEYTIHAEEVPRVVPRLSAFRMGTPIQPRWGQAFLGELYMWGVAASFAMFGWTYNATLVMQGVLVAFGLSIVARGLVRKR